MIRFSLRCAKDHDFESWFASNAAYDTLRKTGHVACPVCGDTEVAKALMAPAVASTAVSVAQPAPAPERAATPAPPDAALAAKLQALRRHVEANSDYVGLKFAAEARAMHLGDAPERPIHGEAKIADARALIEEGVPVAPLPFLPRNRTN